MAAAAIAGLWGLFAITHLGLSSQRWRPRLVGALGALGHQGLYSAVALAIFVPLVWIYFANQHAGPALWYGGHSLAARWLVYLLMALAFALIAGGLLRPSPAGLGGGGAVAATGAYRITRHPVFMATGLFGLVHLLVANVHAAELAFFGGFPVFVWAGCRHQDQRKLAAGGEAFRRFHEATPFLSLAALPRGLAEMPLPLLIGVGLAAGLRYVHPGWFGGAPWFP